MLWWTAPDVDWATFHLSTPSWDLARLETHETDSASI